MALKETQINIQVDNQIHVYIKASMQIQIHCYKYLLRIR